MKEFERFTNEICVPMNSLCRSVGIKVMGEQHWLDFKIGDSSIEICLFCKKRIKTTVDNRLEILSKHASEHLIKYINFI